VIGAELLARYDPTLVILSIIVAVFASYAALDLSARVSAAPRGWGRSGWVVGGAIAMGCGIWSMHFIAMLALELPLPVRYDIWLTALSLVVAIVAAGLALLLANRSSLSPAVVAGGGVCMGTAIAGMHYTGMAAMASPIAVHYHSGLWWTSIGIAVAASCAALVLAFRFKHDRGLWVPPRAGAALLMGAAISGMHYTGMAAAHFTQLSDIDTTGVLATRDLAIAVSVGAFLVLGLAFLSAVVTVKQQHDQERHRQLTEQMLRHAAMALSETGERFFPAVVRELVRTLHAEFAVIGELVPDRPVVKAIAALRHGVLLERLQYDLPGTPSEHVLANGLTAFTSAVRTRFPQDKALSWGAEGYVGTPLIDADGRAIGIMSVISASPLEDEAQARALLQIFAARVSGEMQHARTERELRTSEQVLFQTQKLEAIDRLAGGIAHDFNNLLLIILGYAEKVADRVQDDEKATAQMRKLIGATHRAAAITRRLLAFSRRQMLNPVLINVNQTVRNMETIVPTSVRQLISVSVELADDLPDVMADPVQLDQVLLNLVINARDAMPEGGTLTIGTGAENGHVVITVADTGIGMSAETRARIFEPFFTTKGLAGTGLGLPTVYGIVKQSGGFITCDSVQGRGTTFRVFLPAVWASRVAQSAAHV
jgi:NO-binding membrane sensor protein with MHYT domain/nitrogen-specific signal transduction histidine kinase